MEIDLEVERRFAVEAEPSQAEKLAENFKRSKTHSLQSQTCQASPWERKCLLQKEKYRLVLYLILESRVLVDIIALRDWIESTVNSSSDMYSHLLFKADNVITEQANTFRTERIQMTSSQYINIPQGSVVGLSLTPFIFCLGSSPNFETRIPNSLLLPNLLCVGHITNYLTFNRKKYGFSCS